MSIEQLLMAAVKDDVEWLNALLDQGIDPNTIDAEDGRTALYNAVVGNSIGAIRRLLERGADPNLRFTYRSPVDGRVESNIVALMYVQSPEATETLIQAGADVNATDDAGRTPVFIAANWAKDRVVELLLQAGSVAGHRTKHGLSARDIAEARIADLRKWQNPSKSARVEEQIKRYQRIISLLSMLST